MNHGIKTTSLFCGTFFAIAACAKSKLDSIASSTENFDVALVALRQTHLKSSTQQSSKLRADELCKIEAGERVVILGSPVLINSPDGAHFRFTLSQDFNLKNPCKLDRGMIFAEDIRQEYVQRTAQNSTAQSPATLSSPSGNSQVPAQPGGVEFAWPLKNMVITSGFGPRLNSFHEGIDFSAPVETSVLASAAGQISFFGW
ncbi:hypothetical protein EBR21_07005, partial [bacterium]|nr:hypothetical protein [bacterium]